MHFLAVMNTLAHLASAAPVAAPAAARLAVAAAPTGCLETAPDDALVMAARAGEARALDCLVARYRSRVYFLVRTLLPPGADPEDATQETFTRAVAALSSYQPQGRFRTWLLTIAANVCRSVHRRGSVRRETALDESAPPATAPPVWELSERSALQRAVLRAVDGLPALYRAPVVLHYLHELPLAEVAQILGRSRPALKMQLWRARVLLARELAEWVG